ncbi:MAG: DUF1345 domain-containing protein [Puia sp.]|nr:DUF1345 domain-containing protein [Puia sp.]
MKTNTVPANTFNRIPVIYKMLFSLIIGTCLFLLLLPENMEAITRLMISWDLFGLLMIGMSAITFFTMKPRQIRLLARIQDPKRIFVFVILLVTTLCSLLAIMILLGKKGEWILGKKLETVIYLFGVTCSWFLLHTMFTYRYAHLYYGDHPNNPETNVAGLEIPQELHPDYMDFAYFSFVIGMTFQVSDIQIVSRPMRRLALLHGLLSFLFNTVVVALTINAIVDLKG